MLGGWPSASLSWEPAGSCVFCSLISRRLISFPASVVPKALPPTSLELLNSDPSGYQPWQASPSLIHLLWLSVLKTAPTLEDSSNFFGNSATYLKGHFLFHSTNTARAPTALSKYWVIQQGIKEPNPHLRASCSSGVP